MKKKHKLIIIILFIFTIFIYLLIPYIKLWIYSTHYEVIGTYIIFDKDKTTEIDLNRPIHLVTISDNTNNVAKVTNILYYKELNQLSFGVISNINTFKYMDLKIVDKDNNAIGELLTQGELKFYNKSLEKLYLILYESLNNNEEYTIIITDTDNKVGEVVFKY